MHLYLICLMIVSLLLSFCCCCVFPRWFSSLFLISCCAPLLYWFPPLSSSHTCFRPLLLLVFYYASAFNQDLSSWNVGKVTTMQGSESSVRSLLLLLLLVGRGVLSSVYTSLSSPSLSCGVLPLLVSPPLSLPLLSHWSPPPPPSLLHHTEHIKCSPMPPPSLRRSAGKPG